MLSFLNSIETVAHEFINDAKKVADGEQSWSSYIDRYGHLRPGTYDITSESYADNIENSYSPLLIKLDLASMNQMERLLNGLMRENISLRLCSKWVLLKMLILSSNFERSNRGPGVR